MIFLELAGKIESHEFAVRIGLAEGKSFFLDALAGSDEVNTLVSLLRKDSAIQIEVLNRIRRISGTDIDYRYENPSDIALAAYLHVLHIFDPRVASIAAEIAVRAPSIWWAGEIARSILDPFEDKDKQSSQSVISVNELPLRCTQSL